ncbi:MAG: hypothetical protein H6732_16790 [Alphaproteobacteria bacterium]|nr:hypothetical protein [Alphaproteobacteria bacterium]
MALRTGLLSCLVTSLALGPVAARAQDCETTTRKELEALIAQAAEAVEVDEDVERYRLFERNLQLTVPCLADRVPTLDWARMLYLGAIVRHATGEPWEAWVDAALDVDPLLVRDIGPPELREHLPEPAATWRVPKRSSGLVFFVDGKSAGLPYTLVGPHILQRRGEGGLVNLWVDDGVVPPDWASLLGLAGGVGTRVGDDHPASDTGTGDTGDDLPVTQVPPTPAPTTPTTREEKEARLEAEQQRTAAYRTVKARADKLLTGGVVMLGGGVLLAGASIALGYTLNPERYSGGASALIALEITGWSLAGVGVAVTTAGGIEGKKARQLMVGVQPAAGGAGVFVAGRM